MAVITTTSRTVAPFTLSKTTLSASDSLAYVAGNGQYLELANGTAGSLTATIAGATALASYVIPGTGGAVHNAAGGKAIVVAAGATVGLFLDTLSTYLVGAVTITGAPLMVATVLNGN